MQVMEDINRLIHQLKRSGEYLVTGHEKLTLDIEVLHTIITRVLPSLHTDHNINHHYLSEILKKTAKLKLLKSFNLDLQAHINLTPFQSLIYLELHDIDVEWLIGLNYEKIKFLIIHGPIKSLATLLKRKWANLQYLALRGGHLGVLDESILLAPTLTYLEAPRNLLVDLENIEKLECLDFLNLSINRLTRVPILSDYGARNLTVLILSYNCINNLTGLSKLANLKVLDLSNNMIVRHESISAVGDMAFLKYLNLEHNPIAYIENHREITCRYLHENAAVELFELDDQLLSKSEKKFAGQSSRSLDLSFLHYQQSPTSVKAKKVRSPIIEDHICDKNSVIQTTTQKTTPKKEILKSEHLTTKKQIESLREMYGEENWLHSHAGSYVQDILGIKQQSENELFPQAITEKQPIEESNNFTGEKECSVLSNESHKEMNVKTETVQTLHDSSSLEYSKLNEKPITFSGKYWRAQVIDSKTGKYSNICLCLTERELKERNSIDGHLLATWSRNSIESCVKISFDPIKIQMNFMTIRRNLNQRIYIMSDDSAREFISIICTELESRTLSEMNQLVFKCVKCTTIFCQENNRHILKKRKIYCPNCNSSIVVQMEEEPLPSANKLKQNLAEEENSNDSTPVNSRSSSEEPEQQQLSRNDSDIEIISNPSENSVEILEVISTKEKKSEKTQLTIDVRTALTESSSSGSMTDSVCTAYESRKKRNDSSSLKETGINIDSRIPSVTDIPIQFSYNDFTSIDQRLKFYIRQKYFRENEEFKLVFRCNCIMTSPDNRLDGCVIISNRSLYVFKFIGQPDELLQKVSSHRLSLVKSIATLPWNVGLAICVTQPENDMKYTFVLFVPHITTRLIAFLEKIKPFEQRAVLISSPNTNSYLYVNNILYRNELHLPIIHVVFCESATIVTDNGLVEVIELPGVVITEYELVVLSGECTWLLPYEEHFPTLAHVQNMSNFNHIDKNEETLGLHFNDNTSWLLIVNSIEAEYLMGETIRILTNAKQKSSSAIQIAAGLNCSTQINQIV
ncbi:serine/threonine-protein kinase 11-interacting protein isoform X2 [Sipha flava]|uniref:Serine/threonine-protein kinase 11-interacting protein isoform X2 n=1 Tax=Sipha flava TaxID=143950 RepID=A0A8B8FI55_9HEMI|nr:serine/threonine-protein kinase 11-interacting protein isoform X2 [Sipha flava]